MTPERVGIVGLGLIGGSLALALRGKRGAPEVWGCDRRKAFLDRAISDGTIARACSLKQIAACDIVVVCVPVMSSIEVLRAVGPGMRPGSVLTDVGSVKAQIVREGQKAVAPGADFVGGHPIAGTENSGYPAALSDLYRGRTMIVTPTEKNSPLAVSRVVRLWERTGARVLRMDVSTHDRVFAYVSHLPHVVAYALVHAVSTLDSPVPLGYSAGGFRDFTRIASSNPEMWKDIAIQNKAEILRAVRHYRRNLGLLERLIRARDEAALTGYFSRAKRTRDGI